MVEPEVLHDHAHQKRHIINYFSADGYPKLICEADLHAGGFTNWCTCGEDDHDFCDQTHPEPPCPECFTK